MSLQQEEKFKGKEAHLVPKIDPGENCNAKKTHDEDGGNDGTRTIFDGYCKNKAGKGTDHVGEGRCKHHGGATTGAGPPKHNQNNTKHALDADPHHYAQNLDQAGQQFVEEASNAILRRVEDYHGREPDFLDRILARRVAIKLHMVSKASDHTIDVSGLIQIVQHEHGSHEEEAPLLTEIRRFDDSIIDNLKKLGVLDDPESEKANAAKEWKDFMQSADTDGSTDTTSSDDDVIDVDSEVVDAEDTEP